MGSIVLKSLSVLLGIFFIFVGLMKLTSVISKDLHKDLMLTLFLTGDMFWVLFMCIQQQKKIAEDGYTVRNERKEYVKYAKVFPLSEALNFKVPAKWYRRIIGSLEIICGLAMAFVPINAVKQGANIVLLLLMMMAVYSHYMVNDKFERTAPALVFFFMLTGRMVIDWQLRRKMELTAGTNGELKQKKQD